MVHAGQRSTAAQAGPGAKDRPVTWLTRTLTNARTTTIRPDSHHSFAPSPQLCKLLACTTCNLALCKVSLAIDLQWRVCEGSDGGVGVLYLGKRWCGAVYTLTKHPQSFAAPTTPAARPANRRLWGIAATVSRAAAGESGPRS